MPLVGSFLSFTCTIPSSYAQSLGPRTLHELRETKAQAIAPDDFVVAFLFSRLPEVKGKDGTNTMAKVAWMS